MRAAAVRRRRGGGAVLLLLLLLPPHGHRINTHACGGQPHRAVGTPQRPRRARAHELLEVHRLQVARLQGGARKSSEAVHARGGSTRRGSAGQLPLSTTPHSGATHQALAEVAITPMSACLPACLPA
eukprot:COSAG01_NODE_512_length_16051_cov_33.887161_12_plen_127_part_00